MKHVRAARLTVAVDLMSEPCLWRWEIRDQARDEVVASSWTNDWMAYESPMKRCRRRRRVSPRSPAEPASARRHTTRRALGCDPDQLGLDAQLCQRLLGDLLGLGVLAFRV